MGAVLSLFYSPAAVPHPVEMYFNKMSRYQLWILVWIFSSKLPLFYHMLNHMILSPKMTFYCGGTRLGNGTYTGALNKCPCREKVHWDTSVFTKTTQTKYNLSCGRSWLVALSKSMVYIGLLLGVTIFGISADKFGRRPAVAASFLVTGVAGCLVPFMPEIISFCLMRVVEGMGTGGATVVAYVLMIEYCGPGNREAISALFHIPLNVAHMTLAVVSYLIRDCDHAMFAISAPCILYAIFLPMFVFESPKYLVDTGNTELAAIEMTKICKFNKSPCEDMKSKMDIYLARRPRGHKKSSLIQCFRYKIIVMYFISMAFLFFTCGLAYYGVSQYIAELGSSPHLNIFISGASLIPGTLLCVVILKELKRKTATLLCLIGAGVTFVIAIFIPDRFHIPRLAAASMSNCIFFMLFIVGFLYGCEIFPTSVRNSMLGLLSLISRVGQIMSPMVNYIQIPYIELFFPLCAFISALFLVIPPETKNVLLPATVEETIAMKKEKKKEKGTQTAK